MVMFQELVKELSGFPDQKRINEYCFSEDGKRCPYLSKRNNRFYCLRNSHERLKIEEGNGNKKPKCRGCLDIVLPRKDELINIGFTHKIIIPDERKRGIIEKINLDESKISLEWRSLEGEKKEPIKFILKDLVIRMSEENLIFEPVGMGILVGSMEISENVNKLEKLLKEGL